MRTFLTISLLSLSLAEPANAQCREPTKPYCVNRYIPFESEWDFESCKSDMERYKGDVEIYAQCLTKQIEAAYAQYNEAVRDFDHQAGQ